MRASLSNQNLHRKREDGRYLPGAHLTLRSRALEIHHVIASCSDVNLSHHRVFPRLKCVPSYTIDLLLDKTRPIWTNQIDRAHPLPTMRDIRTMFHPTGRSPRCGMPLEFDCRDFVCLGNYKNFTFLFG